MATSSRELSVIVRVKQDGKEVLKEVKIGIDSVGSSAQTNSQKVEGFNTASARMEQKAQRAGQSLIKMGSSASGLNQALGGLPNMLVEVGDKADNLGMAGLKMSSSMGAAFSTLGGGAGVVGLVITTFITFYKITEKITNQFPEFKKGVEGIFTSMIDAQHAAEDATRSHQQLDREYDLAQAVMKKYNLTQAEFNQKVREAGGDVLKFVGALNASATAANSAAGSLAKYVTELQNMSAIQALPPLERIAAYQAEIEKAVKAGNEKLAKSLQQQLQALTDSILEEDKRMNEQRIENARRTEQEIREGQFRAMLEIAEGNKQAYENDQKNAKKAAEEKKKAEFEYQLFVAESRKRGLDFMEDIWEQWRQRAKETNDAEVAMAKEAAKQREEIRQRELEETKDMFNHLFSFLSGMPGKAGQAFNAVGIMVNSFFQNLGKGVQGWVNIAIDAIGVVTGLLINLFKKNWAKEAEKTTQVVYKFIGALGLSTDFMERFTKAAKESGDAVVTFQLMLKDVIDDLGGITAINADQIFKLAADLIASFDQGKISAQEFSKAFGSAFMDLADFAMKYGGVYLDQLKAMIAATKQLGVEVPEVTQFLSDQLDKLIENVNKFGDQVNDVIDRFSTKAEARFEEWYKKQKEIAGMAKEEWRKWFESLTEENQRAWIDLAFMTEQELNVIQQRWEKLGMFVAATIAEMIEQGRSWGEILQQLGPSIETLIDTAERFGFKAKGAFGELLEILKMMQAESKQFERLDFMGQILDQLALFGRLGPKFIGDFFGQVKKLFADMLGFVGSDWSKKLGDFLNKPFEDWTKQQKTAFTSIIPYILQAADYYRQMGLPLPPMLQQLLNIAKANGLITDTMPKADPLNLILDVLIKMYEAMTGLNYEIEQGATNFRAMGDNAAYAARESSKISGGGGNVRSTKSYQGLHGIHYVDRPMERVIVHEGEKIVGKDTSVGGITFAPGAIVINPAAGSNPQAIADAVVETIRRETRPNGRLTSLVGK